MVPETWTRADRLFVLSMVILALGVVVLLFHVLMTIHHTIGTLFFLTVFGGVPVWLLIEAVRDERRLRRSAMRED